MRINVYAWDADLFSPACRRLHRVSAGRAKEMLARGQAFLVTAPDGRDAVQKYPTAEEKAAAARRRSRETRKLIARIFNPLQQPPSADYPVPMAGDASAFHRANLHRVNEEKHSFLLSRVIPVSSRNIFARCNPLRGGLELCAHQRD
jgi:hypothetical protein